MLKFLPFLILAATSAGAVNRCDTRDALVDLLTNTYGETQQSIGMTGENLMELFASVETGTWTVLISTPSGPTCAVATGQAFEAVSEALPPNL